jgi:hypothetical protein
MIKPFAVAIAALTAALAAVAVAAPVAGAKTETLSYYQVEGPTHFYNAQGRRIKLDPPATLPTAGDRLDETDTDYAGTFKKHAKAWTSTDHLSCTFTSSSTGICNFQIAAVGSLLLFNNFTVDFQDSTYVVKLSEGTGSFEGAHGTLRIADLPNGNSNLVVKVS